MFFAKIVEAGSISGGLTTATASTHLSKLERNLGSALLYRNTRKLSLTHDGASLLETANAMLELYEKGFIEFKQRTISITNKLHISLPAVFQNSVFTHHLAAFIKEYPERKTAKIKWVFFKSVLDFLRDNCKRTARSVWL